MLAGANYSVLDVGCGTGVLYNYMKEHAGDFNYTGIDLVGDMIDHARKKYPGVVFHVNSLEGLPESSFDYIVSSGIYNVRQTVAAKSWEQFVLDDITRQFAKCRRGVVFNLLTDRADFNVEHLYYANAGHWLKNMQDRLSRFVSLDHAHGLYEFTLAVYKEDYILERDRR